MPIKQQKDDLPVAPVKPLPSDCCGGGCNPCVMDLYEEEVRMWELECANLKKIAACEYSKVNEIEILPLKTETYCQIKICDISKETHNTLRVRFSLPLEKSLKLTLGQHIVIRVRSEKGVINRQYTPISSLDAKGFFELIIKIYSDGRASKIIENWKLGDLVDVRGPFGGISYRRNSYKQVLMLCAGTGIAPMCQVISSVLSDERDETLLRLIYSNKTYSDIICKSEITEWRRFWNFSCLFVLSQEKDNNATYGYDDKIHHGRINQRFLKSEACYKDNQLVLVCGTQSFDNDMLSWLKNLEIPETRLITF